ncbi:unnamed protein product [Clonostachys rosea]|uniref:Heterokaryon incompatibility domain-containing protein n=1 Tax=Bionectria ochroleuca TaxID=29856 RepID=A0ABY6UGH7_BIOOC|nr:unnamed protein product [Clonostachys rosea]
MADLDFETLLLSSLLRQHAVVSIHKWLEYNKSRQLHLEEELNRLESIWVACLDLIIETFPEETRRSICSDDQYPNLVLPTAVEKAFPDNETLTEILLLTLEPTDDPSSPIRCNFSVTSLGPDCWPYDVLSYDRGVPMESKTILLGDEEVHVPASLQDPQGWQHGIDGLKAVYSNAQQVHMWLGDEMSGSEMAVGFVESCIIQAEPLNPDYVRELSKEEERLDILNALLSWMERPWWNHAGLMQELLCGCSVRLFWEGYSMTDSVKWDVLTRLPRDLRQAYLDDDPQEPSDLRAFPEMPYLVSTDSMGYFPSFNVFDRNGQVPDSLDELCCVIKRIFTGPNKAQGWIFALAKIGKFLGLFLTHAAVRTSKTGESSSLVQETMSHATVSSQETIDNLAIMECWLYILGKLGVSPKETDTILDAFQCQSNDQNANTLLKAYHGKTSPTQVLLLLPSDKSNSVLRGHTVSVDLNKLSALGIVDTALDNSGLMKETIYSPVDSSKAEIRIITIMHGWRGGPIQCHLSTVSLDDSPSYEALSYVWGDPSSPGHIFLNGRRFSVTRNLACALGFLRHPTQDRTMWIDALCINQDDTAERNSQVQLMSRIYRSAWQVVSWLSDQIQGGREASQLISDTKGCEFSVNWFRRKFSTSTPPRQRRGIAYICILLGISIEYWCRVWISQEVSLAHMGILQFGEYVIQYDDVRRFTEAYTTFITDDVFQLTCIHSARTYALLRDMLDNLTGSELQLNRAPLGTPLLRLLQLNRFKNATDARDKVYALIGLSDLRHSSHQGLRIDYSESRTIRDVYIGVVRAVVDETLSLDIICSTADPRLSKSNPEVTTKLSIPSWVPDWRNTAARMPLSFKDPVGAAGGSPASVGFSAAGEILNAAGFRVGTVGRVGETMPEYEMVDSPTRLSEIWNISRSWYELAKGLRIDPLYRDELFSLTIFAGLPIRGAVEFLDFTADKYDEPPAQGGTTSESGYTISLSERRDSILAGMHKSSQQTSFFLIDPVDKDMASGLSRLPLMGLGLPTMKEGDIICILLGCKAPVVVRPNGSGFKLVSAVYIEPLMKGAAMEDLENGLYDLECFEIH